jgi:hypothetical protein
VTSAEPAAPASTDHERHVSEPAAPGTDLVPAAATGMVLRPVGSEDDLVQAFDAYVRLCGRLLTDDDYQETGKGRNRKKFRKKSGWRKLATAMGVSLEHRSHSCERNEAGRIVWAGFVARATAPNGRFADGFGACDLFERCCPPRCPKADYEDHTCCPEGCDGTRHWTHSQHDIPATAETRAKNRACSDLFGMGEVSAEELIDGEAVAAADPSEGRGGDAAHRRTPSGAATDGRRRASARGRQRPGGGTDQPAVPRRGATEWRRPLPQQLRHLRNLADGVDDDRLARYVQQRYGVDRLEDLHRPAVEALVTGLTRPRGPAEFKTAVDKLLGRVPAETSAS